MDNKFCGLKMVQFECARVINPLVSFTFRFNCGCPFPCMQEKGSAAFGFSKFGNLLVDN